MSTDPHAFEEDLEAIEGQSASDEAAATVPEPTGKKKKKEKKPKVPKAKKEKVAKGPRTSGGLVQLLYRGFPNIYTSMLGLTVLALLVAVVLLLLEVLIPYGGQWRPTGSLAPSGLSQAASFLWIA